MIFSPILPLWIVLPIIVVLFILVMIQNRGLKLGIRIAIIVILFIVNLRPMIPGGEVEVFNSNLDVIFVVDTTLSMDALDYNGNNTRLSAVKNDLTYIVDELAGSSFSVISYDLSSEINLPLTKDNDAVKVSINTLSVIDSLYARGSNITLFKDDLKTILDSSLKKDDRVRIVFIVTDGEANTDDKLASLKDLKSSINGGAVLGYGTTSGGKIKVETYKGSGRYEYLEDRSEGYPYKDAISKIDENNLKTIAKDLGISYIHMEKQSNVDSVLRDIKKMRSMTDVNKEYYYSDIYYYFSFMLIPLFIIELIIDRRMYR